MEERDFSDHEDPVFSAFAYDGRKMYQRTRSERGVLGRLTVLPKPALPHCSSLKKKKRKKKKMSHVESFALTAEAATTVR
jgi:hypothetical protein